jgi:hypothetical protein
MLKKVEVGSMDNQKTIFQLPIAVSKSIEDVSSDSDSKRKSTKAGIVTRPGKPEKHSRPQRLQKSSGEYRENPEFVAGEKERTNIRCTCCLKADLRPAGIEYSSMLMVCPCCGYKLYSNKKEVTIFEF